VTQDRVKIHITLRYTDKGLDLWEACVISTFPCHHQTVYNQCFAKVHTFLKITAAENTDCKI
jgi:hypothetical protein